MHPRLHARWYESQLAYTDLSRHFQSKASSARAGAARNFHTALGFLYGFAVGPNLPPLAQLAILAALLSVSWAARARLSALDMVLVAPSPRPPFNGGTCAAAGGAESAGCHASA